jgi:RecB family exonuclease
VALRQAQRRALERDAFFDGRGHVTLSSFLRECADSALIPNGLRPVSDLDRELAIVEAVTRFQGRKPSDFSLQTSAFRPRLAALPPSALEETLSQLLDTIAPLADRADDFLALLAADRQSPKNPELAALYRTYRQVCHSLGVADEATLNAAILHLLRGDRAQWPALLRQVRTLAFVAVRWVAPFQETVIRALADQLGPDRVLVRHILSDHEQDWWGESLLTHAGCLLFGDAQTLAEECAYQPASTRAAIEHLISLREGLAMQDRALAEQARERTGFSCSVGAYGEIEDLARRIAWELRDRPDPVRPEDIALVTRTLGAASDAIIDVFTRFGIPYYFRRGVPILAVPVIKTLLDFARFSATHERDVFCALLQSPWIDWPGLLDTAAPHPSPLQGGERTALTGVPAFDPALLADDLLRSGVEPVMDDTGRLARRLAGHLMARRRAATRPEADTYARQAVKAIHLAAGNPGIRSFEGGLTDLLARCEAAGLFTKAAGVPPGTPRHAPADRAYLLNAKALQTVTETLATLRRHALLNPENGGSVGWPEIVDLLNRALENMTIAPAPPDEAGVWILNPYDMAGLSFRVVLVANLNAGAFPKSPAQSPLFPDTELRGLRERLQRKGPLPVAALAESRSRNSQENLLFLTTLAAARERMVFSYISHDEAGQDQTPSVFFSTLWRLVGWPAWPTLPAQPPDLYDAWRLAQGAPHLEAHWARHLAKRGKQPEIVPFKRRPFPGESYLGTVPLALCRADDERRQRLAATPEPARQTSPRAGDDPAADLARHIAHAIGVEHQRQALFALQNAQAETPTQAAPDLSIQAGHEYAGVLDPDLWARVRPPAPGPLPDFSPSQLECLVACPYRYYLQYVLRMEPIEPNNLEPSARDFGTAIHEIMCQGFRLLQGLAPAPSGAPLAMVADAHRPLIQPVWAARDRAGLWRLHDTARCPADDALPLVNPALDLAAVLAFFDDLARAVLDWATRGNARWVLGAPEQLDVQRRRIGRAIRNLVRTAFDPDATAEHPASDGRRRYPALLEFHFDSRPEKAAAPSIELHNAAEPGRLLRLHGKIDRTDLVFDDDGHLAAVIVVDYKGSGKKGTKPADLAEGIVTAADCQLPAYALAAAAALGLTPLKGGAPATPLRHPCATPQPTGIRELAPSGHRTGAAPHGRSPDIPVLMQYLSYAQGPGDMRKQSRSHWIGLDASPLEPRDLFAGFTTSVFAALDRYERGHFAVAPQSCGYCELKACCRHAASLLAPEAGPGEGGES